MIIAAPDKHCSDNVGIISGTPGAYHSTGTASKRTDRRNVPKKGNRHHRKSRTKDAHFLLGPQQLQISTEVPVSADSLVANSLIDSQSLQSESLPPTPSPSLSPKTRKSWEGSYVENPKELPRHRFRKPAQWRDITDERRILEYHRAMYSLGPVCAFTLNLNPEVEAKARSETSPANWLLRRIKRELSIAFEKDIPFWFALEETEDDRRMHLHGEIGIPFAGIKLAHGALKRAGGRWSSGSQYQAHIRANPNDGWADYSAKNATWHSPKLKKRYPKMRQLSTISGGWYGSTQTVTREATKHYEADLGISRSSNSVTSIPAALASSTTF